MSVRDTFDVPLDDAVLRQEVDLLADLMVAANQSVRDLAPDELDRHLGLPRGRATCW